LLRHYGTNTSIIYATNVAKLCTHPQRSRATLPKLLWRILTNEVQSRCIALQTVFSTERLSTRGKTHVAICGFRKPTYTVKHFQGKFSNLYSAIMFPTHQFNSAIEVENSPPTNSAQGTQPKATLENTIQTTCKAMTFAVPNTKSNSSFLALLTSRVTAVTPRATDGVLQLKPCIATTTALNLPPRSQTPKSKIPRCTNCPPTLNASKTCPRCWNPSSEGAGPATLGWRDGGR
jgi:hypothetical protein